MINWTKTGTDPETLSANLDIVIDLNGIDPFQAVGQHKVVYDIGTITLPLSFSIYRRSDDDIEADKPHLPYVLEVCTQGPIPSNIIYQSNVEEAQKNAELIRETLRSMVSQTWL